MTDQRSALAVRSSVAHALLRLELGSRFQGGAWGFVWVAIGPLLQLALFALVFGEIFKGSRVSGNPDIPYWAFLALGMWPWLGFADALMRGSTAIVDGGAVSSKVRISPWLFVLARVAAGWAVHAIGFVVVLIALIAAGVPLAWSGVGWSLLAWLLFLLLAAPCALLAASIYVFIRDISQLLAFAVPGLMFLSPILYARGSVPDVMQAWLRLNPMTGLVEMARDPLLESPFDPASVLPGLLAIVVFGLLAASVYRRLAKHMADYR